jgi:hypothetical protein
VLDSEDIRGKSQRLRQPERRRGECHIHSRGPIALQPGMRSRKYRLVTTLERGSNRLISLALHAGFAPHAFAMLETTGRRTGLPRHTPVGNGLAGDTFWLVAAGMC